MDHDRLGVRIVVEADNLQQWTGAIGADDEIPVGACDHSNGICGWCAGCLRRTAKHRSGDSVWEPNDIFDVDALSVVAAYCDVVVTERHAAHVLTQARVTDRLGTRIFTDLDQLAAHLTAAS